MLKDENVFYPPGVASRSGFFIMENNHILVLRDNARNELLQIKTVDEGITYLNKLKSIEIWVKAEKKDAELQNIVAEQKLRTQRLLGKMIGDGQESGELASKGSFNGNRYVGSAGQEVPKTLDDIGVLPKESSKWKQIASIPDEKFDNWIVETKTNVDNAVKELTETGALRLAKGAHVSNNSGENEWYTPTQYIDSARVVMGKIDLDPASSEAANRVIKAKKYYDEKINGLNQKWFGSIWMNPPYSQPLINDFINKLETESYDQAVVLVNNATETRWGQKLLELSHAVCFHTSRIRFVSPEGEVGDAPLQGQMIIYIGKNYKQFIDEFKQYGVCMKKGV